MTGLRPRVVGALAVVTVLGIVIGLPSALLAVGGSGMPHSVPSIAAIKSALASPDDGTLALGSVQVVGWTAWLILTGSILLEIWARIRRVRTPGLPGLGVPQLTAHHLVSAAMMLFIAAPLLTHTASPTSAEPTSAVIQTISGDQQRPVRAAKQPHDDAPAATVSHTVRRGESLWSIARDHLGSGTRYPDIAHLNKEVLDGRPNFLIPGTVLHLPKPDVEQDQPGQRYRVQQGDTLSGIAEQQLGDANRYPAIFDASRRTIQPGGVHLSDPDIIDVDWTLTIPDKRAGRADAPEGSSDARTGPGSAGRKEPTRRAEAENPGPSTASPARRPSATVPPEPTSTPGAATSTTRAGQQPADPQTTTADHPGDELVTPAWLLTGLTGGGMVLAASMLLLLRTRRHSQARARRPGHTIAGPDPVLAPVQRSVTAVGARAAPAVELLDSALRRLAAAHANRGQSMPQLAAVQLSGTNLTLHLSEPDDLDSPWQGTDDHLHWSCPRDVDVDDLGPAVPDQPAPYPLLVTIGSSDSGNLWLLNAEQLGAVSITGDPTYGRDFARYIAAELACNPWSHGVTVHCVGIADEVAAMNPERVQVHPLDDDPSAQILADAIAMINRSNDAGVDVATARATQAGADSWPATVLLVDTSRSHTRPAAELIRLVQDNAGRTGTSVMITGQQDKPDGVVLRLTENGQISIPHAQLDLVAVGLTSDEAQGCAALLAHSDNAENVAIPHDKKAPQGWRSYSNQAGALRHEHTRPRHPPKPNLAQPVGSLLPAADEDYLHKAATTAEDLEVLAPQVPVGVGSAVEESDPTLDADVADWFTDDCDLPRLTLLGPVGARTHGAAIAKRKPYYTELLAYLATRPYGATPDEVADAFSITGPRARNDVKIVRDWLGVNPRTGKKHLPDARDAPAAQARGVGVYQIQGLLTDADLFRRLRVRGEAKGAAGLADLRQALMLVSGEPFDKLRPGGWTWLFEGDRLDQHLVCAIVDVAHILTTHSLQQGELSDARSAATLASRAAPYEEIPRLDLAAVATAEGHTHQAETILRDQVCNRSDDGGPPLELPERTERILQTRDWLQPRKAAS